MSTSLPLPSSPLHLDSMSREVRAQPVVPRRARRVDADADAIRSTMKRAIDVIGALLGLVLLSPVLLAIALLVRLSSPGPVVFRQLRQGHGGQPFWFLKFRPMTADAEERLRDLEP